MNNKPLLAATAVIMVILGKEIDAKAGNDQGGNVGKFYPPR